MDGKRKVNEYSAVIRPERVLDYNRQYINDLPKTSPHGSYFDIIEKSATFSVSERNLWHSNDTAQELFDLRRHGLVSCVGTTTMMALRSGWHPYNYTSFLLDAACHFMVPTI